MNQEIEQFEIIDFCGNAMPYEAIDEFFIVIGKGGKRYDKILKQDVPIGFGEYHEAEQLKEKITKVLEKEYDVANEFLKGYSIEYVTRLQNNQRTEQDKLIIEKYHKLVELLRHHKFEDVDADIDYLINVEKPN